MPSNQKPDLAQIVQSTEIRSRRAMTKTLVLGDPADAAAMAESVARRLAQLPANERGILRGQVLVAVHDLEGLVDFLQSRLNELSTELRKAVGHSAAADSYGRSTHRPTRERV